MGRLSKLVVAMVAVAVVGSSRSAVAEPILQVIGRIGADGPGGGQNATAGEAYVDGTDAAPWYVASYAARASFGSLGVRASASVFSPGGSVSPRAFSVASDTISVQSSLFAEGTEVAFLVSFALLGAIEARDWTPSPVVGGNIGGWTEALLTGLPGGTLRLYDDVTGYCGVSRAAGCDLFFTDAPDQLQVEVVLKVGSSYSISHSLTAYAYIQSLIAGTVENAYLSSSHLSFTPLGEGYGLTSQSGHSYAPPPVLVAEPASGLLLSAALLAWGTVRQRRARR